MRYAAKSKCVDCVREGFQSHALIRGPDSIEEVLGAQA